MEPVLLARSVLLAVPLYLLALTVIGKMSPWLRHLIAIVIGLAFAGGLNLVLEPGSLSYFTTFILMGCVYAVLALGLNVQWGYTGLFNIGIAAFFAVGAFTSALVTSNMPEGALAAFTQQAFGLGAPFVVGVLAAGLASGLLALLIGGPTLRLRGDYLAIATIGIGELTRLFFQNERWLANGPQPLRGIPQPLNCLVDGGCSTLPGFVNEFFAMLTPRDYPYVYVAIVALVLFLVYQGLERAIRSPWGRVLRAVREDEDAAAMNGKNVAGFRMQAFVVGSVVMGIGGSLYAHYVVAIDYSHFDPLYGTFLIWVMLMLGGSGNNRGAILGALLVWAIWTGTSFIVDAMRPALAAISPVLPQRGPYIRYLLISILMLVIVLYRPRGILPEEKVVSLAND
ncbi:MAG TPA: branched-chain amino acid ABC transporter permease [Trueperaceae bacterium]|nr:branched-chain amino acid ABC transporter permease [Trueperaceae bacterium]